MNNETQLISNLKKGEKHAVHAWYREFSPKLRSFFRTKVKHEADVDELTHDTFLSCLSSLPLYRGESSLYSWMLSIARHELADYYRKLYAKKVIAALPLGDQLLDAVSHEIPAMQSVVTTVLAKLPEAISELLALKYIDKLSVEAIASNLSVSPHTIQSRLYRARNAFKKAYDQAVKESDYEEN